MAAAVFKPQDEEPGAAFNPRGRSAGANCAGSALRRGVRPGEGAVREVAAFLLDRNHFAGVPPTALVSCQPQVLLDATAAVAASLGSAPALAMVGGGVNAAEEEGGHTVGVKVGSLQHFVHAESDCEDRGPAQFAVQEVHKIAQLDMRLANTDRNGGNILARRRSDNSWQLIPARIGSWIPCTCPQYLIPTTLNKFPQLRSLQLHCMLSVELPGVLQFLSTEAVVPLLLQRHLLIPD